MENTKIFQIVKNVGGMFMKIPLRIEYLLERREYLAFHLQVVEVQFCVCLTEKGADFSDTDICDSTISGCMIYAEPTTAKQNVRQYILEKL